MSVLRLVDEKRKFKRAALILPALTLFASGYELSGAQAESRSARRAAARNVQSTTTTWNHNGSIVSLITEGNRQRIVYQNPRVGLLDAGVKPGMLLFEGQKNKQAFTGTAYMFYRTCKPHSYAVTGDVSDDQHQITLKGKAPLLDMNCSTTGSREDLLIFTAIQSAPTAKSESEKAAEAAPPASMPAPPVAGANAMAKAAPPTEVSKEKAGAAEPKPESKASPETKPESAGAAPAEPAQESKTEPAKSQVAAIPPDAAATAKSAPVPEAAAPSADPPKEAPAAKAEEPKPAGESKGEASPQLDEAPPAEITKEIQTAAIPPANTAKVDEGAKPKDDNADSTQADRKEAPVEKTDKIAAAPADAPAGKTPAKASPMLGNEKMMEIVLKNGRILRIGRDVDLETLSRLIAMLERQE